MLRYQLVGLSQMQRAKSRRRGELIIICKQCMSNYDFSIHIGKNPIGNTFGMAYKDFDTTIGRPFQQFVRSVYCEYMQMLFIWYYY
jgi:hypothetical protein